jgi:hypothetical protein
MTRAQTSDAAAWEALVRGVLHRGDPWEKTLDAMRGNRSSSASLVSYHLWGRLWRLAT